MVPKDPARNMAAKEASAARIISKRGPPGAATRSRKTMIMTRTTRPATTSFRKPQRPCASMVAPRCIHLTGNSSSGHARSHRWNQRLTHGSL